MKQLILTYESEANEGGIWFEVWQLNFNFLKFSGGNTMNAWEEYDSRES